MKQAYKFIANKDMFSVLIPLVLFGVLVLWLVINSQPTALEVKIADFSGRFHKGNLIYEAAYLVQQLGGLIAVSIACVAGAYMLAANEPRKTNKAFALISFPIVVYVLVLLLKLLVDRDRPSAELADPSFPSLHAAICFSYVFLYKLLKSDNKIPVAVGAIPFLVGLSRIVTGKHYLLDVIGGLLLGYTVYKIYNSIAAFQD